MKNYSKTHTAYESRTELHDTLNLTGCEISKNTLCEGTNVPFVHSHKNNEEIYYIVSGKGYALLDNEKVELNEGDFIKVNPICKRQIFAKTKLTYICIQVRTNSLEGYTLTDAIVE